MKQLLTILLLLTHCIAFAQLQKDDLVIDIDGSYTNSNDHFGVTSNAFTNHLDGGNVSASMGFVINDHFIWGLGLAYSWGNNKTTNRILLESEKSIQWEELKTDFKLLLPKVYVGYRQMLTKNISLGGILQAGYGDIRSECTSTKTTSTPPNIDNEHLVILEGGYWLQITETKKNISSLQCSLSPEINWFVSSHIALTLKMGGINYINNDWDSNLSKFSVNFNPESWVLGLRFRIS